MALRRWGYGGVHSTVLRGTDGVGRRALRHDRASREAPSVITPTLTSGIRRVWWGKPGKRSGVRTSDGDPSTDRPLSPATARQSGGYVPLFWRLFIPNATVLACACVVLLVQPANGRIVVLVGGLVVMLAVNLLLMRRTIRPLVELARLMDTVDLVRPGRRLPPIPVDSEVGLLANSFNAMLERLEEERRRSQRTATLAQEEEQRRIAAELHDGIGQRLTALILELDRAARMVDGPGAERLADAVAGARAALEEVRGLARRVRPELLDELGLVPALRNLCDRLERHTGITILRSLPADATHVPRDVELAVYRIAQESLTNVLRHAGATNVRLSLATTRDGLELTVTDDGVGGASTAGPEGVGGIRGMEERALTVSGVLDVGPAQGGGTQVRLRVPVGVEVA